jgi:hypothetical protein
MVFPSACLIVRPLSGITFDGEYQTCRPARQAAAIRTKDNDKDNDKRSD